MTEKPYTYTDRSGDSITVGRMQRAEIQVAETFNDKIYRATVYAPKGRDAVDLARAILTAAGDTEHRVVSEEWLTTVIKINREDAVLPRPHPLIDEVVPVYESPEELAQEIARLRRENAALQRLVTRAEKDIATLTRDRDQALEEAAPAPRDTDLTQQVRALVKRYGAPVIAAEAARQAKHH